MNIVTGPYPLYEVDVEGIVNKAGIDAVLNLMTDDEMKQRGLNEN